MGKKISLQLLQSDKLVIDDTEVSTTNWEDVFIKNLVKAIKTNYTDTAEYGLGLLTQVLKKMRTRFPVLR